jgi:glycosyltransferase involved in cell wall biosynthesis
MSVHQTETRPLTVAICTYNRASYLEKALASLASQTANPSTFEVIVVDNASTDATPQVVVRWQQACPAPIRYVREERLGLSYARNRALAETASPYIAYLDDDAIATAGWVASLLSSFMEREPRPQAVGGPIKPIWEAPRPEWLPDGLLGYLTVLERPVPSKHFRFEEELIFGANMAFERSVLQELGGFDPSLGRVGTNLLSGEEILVMRQLRRRGAVGYFNADAVVHHHVSASRLTKSWFYNRVYWGGMSYSVVAMRLESMSLLQRAWTAVKLIRSHLYRDKVWRALPGIGDERSRFGARCRALNAFSAAFGYLRFR